MRSSFAPAWTACCVAVGLMLTVARGAEPPHPLMGATRDQVLARYGEPKGQIALGSRTVLTYPREKLVLRDNVVIEVEVLSAEPIRRPAPAPVEAAPVTPVPAPVSAIPTVGTENAPTAPVSTSSPAASTPAPEPKFEIKLVRPPSAGGAPAPKRETPAPVAVVEVPKPLPVVTEPEVAPAPPKPDPVAIAQAARAAQAAAEAVAQEKRLKSAQSARRRLDFAETAENDEGGSGKSIAIGLGVIIAGLGGLVWWRRRHSLELAATSVASTPVKKAAPAPVRAAMNAPASSLTTAPFKAPAPGVFSPELIAHLDASRFEELVAAYFTKTGVVATRTKTGAASPVHLRISWKGEPRAFACAHCIAPVSAPIDARALHGFVAALAAEELRRGYVVTSGVFSDGARDFAAAKHLTLMPVDVLLEKIAGLPEAARKELLQLVAAVQQAA